MNSRGLNQHDIKLFSDLLIGANDTQLVYLRRELVAEIDRRIAKSALKRAEEVLRG